ncbi:MAG TPA: carbohydrate ABC transporter permease [Spirochaetota bacterium]|nr:carbohydrate ABC transporter permease [Spirochaetota bacterium]HOD16810.1 carbohydrate ABC transporter permease [Spirochaetota bacterium]HPG51717.1 carbohydrate ABC transporter permease [Spirochaetota bacterium]HPN12929.1 carbohydrate ABC transporter permease [Spirochaetota bacterium]HQL83834.1 carbohydrate ABC transporter permease [Spirochaetota bacterium]
MIKRAGFYALLAVVMLYCAGPLAWQLITSIKPSGEIAVLPPLVSTNPTAAHYLSVFHDYSFARYILNSLIVAGSTTILSLLVGSICSFGLAKLRVPFASLVLAFILSVSMFPPIATVSPLYIIIRTLGLRDTLAALVMTHTVFSLPLTVWVLTNFFRTVPDDIYHAARIDGCRPFQVYWKIMLPLSLPAVYTTAILVFIFSWNEFLFALTFTSSSARTVPVAIALFPGIHEMPWGEIAAASVIVTLPIILLVLFFQRKIVEGLTSGAVKG